MDKFNQSNANTDASRNSTTKYKWSDTSKEHFIEQIDLSEVLHIKENIDRMEPSHENINLYTNRISNLFEKAAQIALKSQKKLHVIEGAF